MSHDWPGAERRRVTRKLLNQTVLLSVPGDAIVTPCAILNLSVLGACIELKGTPLLPTDFRLSFDQFREHFDCRLVWRQCALAGLQFVF